MHKILSSNILILKQEKTSPKLSKKPMVQKVTFFIIIGLGILFVNGIPDYPEARKAALPSIWQLGNLPP
jgi:hypothetical protein